MAPSSRDPPATSESEAPPGLLLLHQASAVTVRIVEADETCRARSEPERFDFLRVPEVPVVRPSIRRRPRPKQRPGGRAGSGLCLRGPRRDMRTPAERTRLVVPSNDPVGAGRTDDSSEEQPTTHTAVMPIAGAPVHTWGEVRGKGLWARPLAGLADRAGPPGLARPRLGGRRRTSRDHHASGWRFPVAVELSAELPPLRIHRVARPVRLRSRDARRERDERPRSSTVKGWTSARLGLSVIRPAASDRTDRLREVAKPTARRRRGLLRSRRRLS